MRLKASALLPLALSLETQLSTVVAQNGSCISAPQSACASLVGICVSQVATGQIPSNKFWSSPVCFAAAVCSGPGPVIDAACCAGTCVSMTAMTSLDYNLVYAPMVGSCAFASGGCPVTWTDLVNYFYNTIQATNTNNWPFSGDDVLSWWSDIATWTAFCSGTLCVNGQIPYLNLNDWLHFYDTPVVTFPGNQPIHYPPSTDRDNNTDVWDPLPDSPCPFDNPSFCFDDNTPQTPPDSTNVTSAAALQPRAASVVKRKLAVFPVAAVPASTAANLVGSVASLPKYFPPNIPPPVYISNGTEKVPLELSLSGARAARRNYSLVDLLLPSPPVHLVKRPAVRSDRCRSSVASIDVPNPLPVLTYYCDYMPNICENIRGSGFLTNDQVILTYDPFGSNTRRDSVCTEAVKDVFREGGCNKEQHDPLDWLVSCDEFPFNAALEGGKDNGAVVKAVPQREQGFQSTLQTAVSKLLLAKNDARSRWSSTSGRGSKYPGNCHRYTLKLVDIRPLGTLPTVVGTLDPGGAFIQNKDDGVILNVTRGSARPPPLPRAPYDYPSDAIALRPTASYRNFDCRPCTIGSVSNPVPRAVADMHARSHANSTTSIIDWETDFGDQRRAATTCTKKTATSTPSPTSDAQSNAAAAAAAAAAAKAGESFAQTLSGAASQPADVAAAAKAASEAAEAAALAAAAAAAAALANNPAGMALTLGSTAVAQDTLQSTISSLTDIFGLGTIPDSIASIMSSVTIAASSVSSVLDDVWNIKPPGSNPVPPDSDPTKNPSINSAGGSNVTPAACFSAGSTGKLTVNGGFTWLSTGTSTQSATITDAGNAAYFGLTLANDGAYGLDTLCPGVYAWFSEPSLPSFQVDCSSHEFGSFWNTVKQTCYVFPMGAGLSVVCGTDVGNIYGCLQSQGFQSQVTPISMTWSS
ncbi:hypothetical protein C8F01DRAFT_1235910 [Mycena amicta]|nr:hypothetical protein C8F01DRAFT_1235910 [Mycena amicta]